VAVQGDLDRGVQAARVEGLGDVAERFSLAGAFDWLGVGVGGQEDDRDTHLAPEDLGDGDAVIFAAQADVDQGQVGALLGRQLQGADLALACPAGVWPSSSSAPLMCSAMIASSSTINMRVLILIMIVRRILRNA